MTYSGRRLPRALFLAPSAAVLVMAAAGCSSSDAQASITVPTPSSEAAAYCEALHKELPKTVAGMDRSDPEPDSDLTAGWGDGAIVLRCGVPRPSKMEDAQSDAVDADGVNWLLEQREGAGPRFTTTYRKAYVEVTLPEEFAHDITPLAEFAASVGKTVPKSL
ncbi:DUF3515 domain-containing protein [Streptomyces sp. NPDC057136]|uniref:DUF3515 domain-containing protein n=1 Tax=Streptomyces sp. NPDC057136 TaxID=3346029 RepID=UPI003634FD7A